MDIRAQVSMVFHLDKCIGCHTCSIACKNIWSDREGAEYMWWNNVETKPGTGFPTKWEDQDKYQGGFERREEQDGTKVRLKLQGRLGALSNIFHNPYLPSLDDYYEPWTYEYEHLFTAPESAEQPTARAISLITGKYMDIESGPNWDDDLGGSPIYAANDPNLENLTEAQRDQMSEIERVVFFYLPRICNHCLNPGCVGACPSGAAYKRGEDGIVLINQDKCRGWRMCVSGCPYKKTYYNWSTGKSEKCILCFPRLESGQPPACFQSCVGRIRYLGVLLYDADQIETVAGLEDQELVKAQRALIQDPNDPEVIAAAKANGISHAMIESAQRSPVYKFVKEWELALPLHPEFRTLPMLFYVPPMLPVLAGTRDGQYEVEGADAPMLPVLSADGVTTTPGAGTEGLAPLLSSLAGARLPMQYLANLFTAGNVADIEAVYRKLIAVRIYMRHKTVGDIAAEEGQEALAQAGISSEVAEAMHKLTALPTFSQRFQVPPMAREMAVETQEPNALHHKREAGFGRTTAPKRRF